MSLPSRPHADMAAARSAALAPPHSHALVQRTATTAPAKSPFPWWHLLAAVLGVAGIGAAAYFLVARKQKQRAAAPTSPPLATTTATAATANSLALNLDAVVDRASAAIDRMAAGDVSGVDMAEWRRLLAVESTLCAFDPAVGLAVVKLFTTYHTLQNLFVARDYDPQNPASIDRVTEWEREQTKDLTQAWQILDRLEDAPDARTADTVGAGSGSVAGLSAYSNQHLLALELAQRLKDVSKLRSAFTALLSEPSGSRSDEVLLALFMTAPMLGAWSEMRTLGGELIARKGADIMHEFHVAALQESIYPDFQLLYDRAHEFNAFAQSQCQSASMTWGKFDVTELTLTHDTSFSPDPAMNFALQQMAAQGKEPRLIRPQRGEFPFSVTGAIARMQSPFIIELPCVGVYTQQKFQLFATAKVSGDPTIGESDSQAQSQAEITLECSLESHEPHDGALNYVGHFTVRDFALDSAGVKRNLTVQHIFHIELTIQPSAR